MLSAFFTINLISFNKGNNLLNKNLHDKLKKSQGKDFLNLLGTYKECARWLYLSLLLRAVVVTKFVTLGISSLTSFILALRVILIAK